MKAYIVQLSGGTEYDTEVASVVFVSTEKMAREATRKRLSERPDLTDDRLEVQEIFIVPGSIVVAGGHDSTFIKFEFNIGD